MSDTKAYRPALYPKGIKLHSQSFLQEAVIKLTAAQLIAMGTTPVVLLPAPGAGKAIAVESIVMEVVRTSTAFTGGGVLNFQYHTSTSIVPHASTIPASFLTGAAGTALNQLAPNTQANGLSIPANEGIDITNTTAAFAAGTGVAYVYIRYRIITLN